MAEQVRVQVCYATAAREILRELVVDAGTSIEQAIGQSGLLRDFPGIDLARQPVGIFGKKRPLDTVVRERDRIEIYRGLVSDPKNARRRRVARNSSTPDAST